MEEDFPIEHIDPLAKVSWNETLLPIQALPTCFFSISPAYKAYNWQQLNY